MLPKICYISHRIPWKASQVAVRCIFCKNFIHNLLKLVSLYNIQTLHNILASPFRKGSIFQYLSNTISAGFRKKLHCRYDNRKTNVKCKNGSSVEFCSDRWVIEDPTYMYRAWTHYLQCLLHNKCQGITNMNNISCI